VVTLQTELNRLGFVPGAADGVFGTLTQQAVDAAQGYFGLTRDGVAGPVTLARLATARATPAPTWCRATACVDVTRGVLFLQERTRRLIVHVSTGGEYWYRSPSGGLAFAHTPRGSFTIYRKIPGWHRSALGLMYDSSYLYRGYAIHGDTIVPPNPVSHGCVRVTMALAARVYADLPIGAGVTVR
jgi:peptidoglycan hydrolase-like protein with peptidoglycan-binding domain